MMNRDQPSSMWPSTFEDEAMGERPADNGFSNFLDLSSDFPDFEAMDCGQPPLLDTPMGDLDMDQMGVAGNGGEIFNGQTHHDGGMGMDATTAAFQDHSQSSHMMPEQSAQASMHQPAYQRQSNKAQQPRYTIPPTPTSSEIHGAASYYHHADQNNLVVDTHQFSFTPLVSPAVTPLESSYRISDYAMPGEYYFSPLTSPMIEPQYTHGNNLVYPSAPGSETGTTSSPVDLNKEGSKTKSPTTLAARRGRRKQSTSTRAAPRGPKQLATRRSQPVLDQVPSNGNVGTPSANTPVLSSQPPSLKSNVGGSSEGSIQSSVSPEALSEALMPPPALPRHSRSPNLVANGQDAAQSTSHPATPAMIMRMPSSRDEISTNRKAVGSRTDKRDSLEEIMLPEPATLASNSESIKTPTMVAKGPRLGLSNTPRSVAMSPTILSPLDTPMHKIPDLKGRPPGPKKRQSGTSVTVSPSILPRISPSLKPYTSGAPGTASISAETSALYLASKSNYQNILEGTHLPGVSYPEALAENLSSKRTSHKIAEQGRRNRINTALNEISTLLKEGGNIDVDEPEGDKTTAAGQSNSKASTVEKAIVYIKALQSELDETKKKLSDAEAKLGEKIAAP